MQLLTFPKTSSWVLKSCGLCHVLLLRTSCLPMQVFETYVSFRFFAGLATRRHSSSRGMHKFLLPLVTQRLEMGRDNSPQSDANKPVSE